MFSLVFGIFLILGVHSFKSPASVLKNNGTRAGIMSVETNCGVKEDSYFSYFHSPNFPDCYPSNSSCYWTIEIPNSDPYEFNIALMFDPLFEMEGWRCVYDYLVVYDGPSSSSPQIGKFCQVNPPPRKIISSTNKIHVEFISDQRDQHAGFFVSFQECYPSSCDDTIGYTGAPWQSQCGSASTPLFQESTPDETTFSPEPETTPSPGPSNSTTHRTTTTTSPIVAPGIIINNNNNLIFNIFDWTKFQSSVSSQMSGNSTTNQTREFNFPRINKEMLK